MSTVTRVTVTDIKAEFLWKDNTGIWRYVQQTARSVTLGQDLNSTSFKHSGTQLKEYSTGFQLNLYLLQLQSICDEHGQKETLKLGGKNRKHVYVKFTS